MTIQQFKWTHAQVTDLRELWAKGIGPTEIARRMGVPKNAVSSKANRIGLTGDGIAARADAKLWFQKDCAPIPALKGMEAKGREVSLSAMSAFECRYPVSDGEPWLFCGEPKARGAYCAHHAKLCYQPEARK